MCYRLRQSSLLEKSEHAVTTNKLNKMLKNVDSINLISIEYQCFTKFKLAVSLPKSEHAVTFPTEISSAHCYENRTMLLQF